MIINCVNSISACLNLNNANTIHIHADPQTLRIFPLETALLVAGAVAHTLVFWLFGLI